MMTIEKYTALPVAEFKYPIYASDCDRYFYYESEVADWCADENVNPFRLWIHPTERIPVSIDLKEYIDENVVELEFPLGAIMSQGQLDLLQHYENCIRQLVNVVLDNHNVCVVDLTHRLQHPKEWEILNN